MYTIVITKYTFDAFQDANGKPKGRGLSGEHIKLCAEGARCKPNLSGKRTENDVEVTMTLEQSSKRAVFYFVIILKEGNILCTANPWILLAL